MIMFTELPCFLAPHTQQITIHFCKSNNSTVYVKNVFMLNVGDVISIKINLLWCELTCRTTAAFSWNIRKYFRNVTEEQKNNNNCLVIFNWTNTKLQRGKAGGLWDPMFPNAVSYGAYNYSYGYSICAYNHSGRASLKFILHFRLRAKASGQW